MVAGGGAVGGDHDALAGGQSVVLDHPGGAEAIERRVEVGRGVDDLAVRGADAGRGHDVLGERLRPLDPGGVGGRAEAGDPGRADGVGDTEHQRHLGADDDQVGAATSRASATTASPDATSTAWVSAMLGDPGVAGGTEQLGDRRVSREGQEQGVFTGSGTDDEYAHGASAYGPDADASTTPTLVSGGASPGTRAAVPNPSRAPARRSRRC